MREITTYKAFWPYYLREHSQAATRGWHYIGTSLALLTLFLIIVTGKWLFSHWHSSAVTFLLGSVTA